MQKIYKFNFQAAVQTVTLALKFPCVVSITWRRGEKIAEVKQRKEIERGVVTFNETLDLECNMSFDPVTKRFEEKKTKFTVLIFSEKGNKQAGELSFDVSEFLNAKQKEQRVEKLLEKCPDKNAKLTFVLTGYVKEEVQPDAVSHKSDNQSTTDASPLTPSVVLQPDFKKKKQDIPSSPRSFKKDKSEVVRDEPSEQRAPIIPAIKKESKERLKMEEENRKLRSEVELLRQLEVENSTLRRRYEEAEKKAQSYYTKKMEEARREYEECKVKAKKVEELQQKKLDLQKEMCDCKQKMGRILNYAIMSGNNEMTEQIYNIYQNSKP